MTSAFEDGYAFAQELSHEYHYSAERIRDAATAEARDNYVLWSEREDFDHGVAIYLGDVLRVTQ